jgi:hypothetical protein
MNLDPNFLPFFIGIIGIIAAVVIFDVLKKSK